MLAMPELNSQTMPASGEEGDRTDVKAIMRVIRDADRRVRERFPVLRHQSAIGMAFVALGYGTAAISTWLFIKGINPAWLCIVINALSYAVLREIEHDLIHNLYFKNKRALQNFVLFVIWPSLGNVPNPLFRRKVHLQHHASSGHDDDLEERLIGNGTGFGPLRWFAMIESGLSLPFRRRELESIPGFNYGELMRALVPVNVVFYFFWLSFLGYHGAIAVASLAGLTPTLPAWLVSFVAVMNVVVVSWVLPNVIRQACLHVLSSSMHYHGDVENTVQQTQVLSKWYWLPLQVFSCNFGSSHAIHHFLASQPFYLRELVRTDAHAAMRRHGVRFDDLGTFSRANRWGAAVTA